MESDLDGFQYMEITDDEPVNLSTMSMKEIFEYSLSSPAAKNRIKSQNGTATHLKWMTQEREFSMTLYFKGGVASLHIKLISPCHVPKGVPIKTLMGMRIPVLEHSGHQQYHVSIITESSYPAKMALLEALSTHVYEIFKVESYRLESDVIKETGLSDSFIFKQTQKFEQVVIYQQALDAETVEFLFNRIHCDRFVFDSHFNYSTPPKIQLIHENIELDSFYWIPWDTILQMRCHSLKIRKMNPHFSFLHFVDLIMQWYHGHLPNLRLFEMRSARELTEINGMDMREWAEQCERMDMILRENDIHWRNSINYTYGVTHTQIWTRVFDGVGGKTATVELCKNFTFTMRIE